MAKISELPTTTSLTGSETVPLVQSGVTKTSTLTVIKNWVTSAITGFAASGANSDITSLSGLTTPLSVPQGGTAATTASNARTNLGAAASGLATASGLTQSTSRLLGRTTAGTGAIEEISVGAGLSLSAGSLSSTSTAVQIQPISASVVGNALTISASALSLDFRSTTLGSGTVTTVSGTPSNLVISSGSTLGTTSAVQSDIAVLAINNAGTIDLAAVNIAGGTDLSETGLISTTAEGGAGAADSATVIYSTTARTNVAYRVVGILRSTQATAGTWATAPSLIQGIGGLAFNGVSRITIGTPVNTTSGTSVDFTGIPSCKRITMMLNGVSTNGTSSLLVQLGAGSIETSGYKSTGASFTSTAFGAVTRTDGFVLHDAGNASDTYSGSLTFTYYGAFGWMMQGIGVAGTVQSGFLCGGSKTLAGTLDRIRITTVAGTSTFDAGSFNIAYE